VERPGPRAGTGAAARLAVGHAGLDRDAERLGLARVRDVGALLALLLLELLEHARAQLARDDLAAAVALARALGRPRDRLVAQHLRARARGGAVSVPRAAQALNGALDSGYSPPEETLGAPTSANERLGGQPMARAHCYVRRTLPRTSRSTRQDRQGESRRELRAGGAPEWWCLHTDREG